MRHINRMNGWCSMFLDISSLAVLLAIIWVAGSQMIELLRWMTAGVR